MAAAAVILAAEGTESELGDFAERADGGGVGFAGDAAGNEGEEEGEDDGEDALPPGHGEGGVGEPAEGDEGDELAGGEPGHGGFDGFHLAGEFVFPGEQPGNALAGAEQAAPLEGKFEQTGGDHAGNAEPKGPLGAFPEAASLADEAGVLEGRHEHHPAGKAADEHADADAHAHDGTGGDHEGFPIDHHGAPHPERAKAGFIELGDEGVAGPVGDFGTEADHLCADARHFTGGVDEVLAELGDVFGEHVKAVVPEVVDGGDEAGDTEGLGGAHAFGAAGMEGAEGFGGGDAAGEAELLDVDELLFHGHGHGDAEDGEEEDPGEGEGNGEGVAVQEDEGGEGGDEGAAGGVAGGAGGGLHAIVLQNGHRGLGDPDFEQRGPDGVGQDAGGDGDAEAPAGFQADVEIGERENAAEEGAHEDGAPGELAHGIAAAAIDLLEPLAFDLCGRAFETGDGQFKISLRRMFRRVRFLNHGP